MKRSRGFTLVELLVVVGIIALLVTMLFPTLKRAIEITEAKMCMANLKSISHGLLLYRTQFKKFPLLHTQGDVSQALGAATDSNILNPSVLGANYAQNWWIMIEAGDIDEAHFKCPSDGFHKTRKKMKGSMMKKYGWIGYENFSYGMHKPYTTASGDNKACLVRKDIPGEFVIFTDKSIGKNRGAGKLYYTNANDLRKPANHPRDGFNYLLNGYSVQSAVYSDSNTSPSQSDVGIAGDDVFLAGDNNGTNLPTADVVNGSPEPTDDTDVFIVPWKKPGTSGW